MISSRLKYTFFVLVVVIASFGMTACKRAKQIPRETLADIFKDMYYFNAYMDRARIMSSVDSVDIYKPILDKYGYSEIDFKYTLTEASKRKSFRLSEIVDMAIVKLETDYAKIETLVKRREYVDSLALALSTEDIYSNPIIKIRSVADTASILIPIKAGSGQFKITYNYKVDSTDLNAPMSGLTNKHDLLNEKGEVLSSSSLKPRFGERVKYETMVSGSDKAVKIKLRFGNYPKKPKRMNLTVDSLVVTRQLPIEQARKALIERYVGYKLKVKEKEYEQYIKVPADSSTLNILPPFAPEGADSLGG